MYTINGNYKNTLIEHFENTTTDFKAIIDLANKFKNGEYPTNIIKLSPDGQIEMSKNDDAFNIKNITGQINIESGTGDKKNNINLTGKSIKIDGELCIGDVCINKEQLKKLIDNKFGIIEVDRINIRNDTSTIPNISLSASSVWNEGKKPEFVIARDGQPGGEGIYVRPGNKNERGEIFYGATNGGNVLVSGREGYIQSTRKGHHHYLLDFDGNQGAYFDNDDRNKSTKLIFHSA